MGPLLAPDEHAVEDVVVFGAGQVGAAIARSLTTQGIGVRVIEPDRERAREVAEELPAVPRLQHRRESTSTSSSASGSGARRQPSSR